VHLQAARRPTQSVNFDLRVQHHLNPYLVSPRDLMWTLECDGDIFERKSASHNTQRSDSMTIIPDKRLWLKPGDPLILGRTHPGRDGSSKNKAFKYD